MNLKNQLNFSCELSRTPFKEAGLDIVSFGNEPFIAIQASMNQKEHLTSVAFQTAISGIAF